MVFLSNGAVAWEIPRGPISYMYEMAAYLPPAGWHVEIKPDHDGYRWTQGEFGEWRIVNRGAT